MLGYSGPKIMSAQGNCVEASIATDPAATTSRRAGNSTRIRRKRLTGYRTPVIAQFSAFAATGTLQPVKLAARAASIDHAVG